MVAWNTLSSVTVASPVDQSQNDENKQEIEAKRPLVIDKPVIKISPKQQVVGSEGDKEHINNIRNYMLSRNKSLEVYGLVVDQYDQPISDAEIVYSISFLEFWGHNT